MKPILSLLLGLALAFGLPGVMTPAMGQQSISPRFSRLSVPRPCWHEVRKHTVASSIPILTTRGLITATRHGLYRWTLKSKDFISSAHLYRSAARGYWWEFVWNDNNCAVQITPDPEDNNDPRQMKMEFEGQTWYFHNREPDMNAIWYLSQSSDPLDESRYIASMKTRIEGTPWQLSAFRSAVPEEVKLAFIFASVNSLNLRYESCLRHAGK